MNINQWLSDPTRTYKDGLEIYNASKRTPKHDVFFSSVKDSKQGELHFNFLERELRNLARISGQQPSKAAPEKPAISIKPIVTPDEKKVIAKPKPEKPLFFFDSSRYDFNKLSADMKKLFEENQQLTKEISSKSEKLKLLGKAEKNKTARAALRKSLDELEKKRGNNWSTIDKWWNENITNPAPKTENVTKTPDEIAKEIEAAKQYIRRYGDSKKAEILKEVENRKSLLKQYGVKWEPKKK